MSNNLDKGQVLIIGIAIGLVLGGIIIGNIVMQGWRKESIKQGYAEYNQINGKWQWKDLKGTE